MFGALTVLAGLNGSGKSSVIQALDGVAVSLPSEKRWRESTIRLHHVWLNENGAAGSGDVEVLNLSGLDHAPHVRDSLLSRRQHDLTSEPSALAARKKKCFPHLAFGLDVDEHFAHLPTGLLAVVVRKLILLDDASRAWRRDPAKAAPTLSGCRPESEPTMQQHGHRRVFRDAAGNPATYELHCNAGSGYRIHMRVTHEPRGLEIGYVGKHLPTMRFP